jgi:hypothetical protein
MVGWLAARVARLCMFSTKNPTLGKLGEPSNEKGWYILWPLGIY